MYCITRLFLYGFPCQLCVTQYLWIVGYHCCPFCKSKPMFQLKYLCQIEYLFKVGMNSSLSDCTKLKLIIMSKIYWYIAIPFIHVHKKFLSNKCILQSLKNRLQSAHLGSSSRTSLKSTMQFFLFLPAHL